MSMESYFQTVAGWERRAIWDWRPSLYPWNLMAKGITYLWSQVVPGIRLRTTLREQKLLGGELVSGCCMLQGGTNGQCHLNGSTQHNWVGVCQSDIFHRHNLTATICQVCKGIIAGSRINAQHKVLQGARSVPFFPDHKTVSISQPIAEKELLTTFPG